MFKTILATAAAALLATAIATPAQAGAGWFNGVSENGIRPNGTASNHQSFTIDGIELPARQ